MILHSVQEIKDMTGWLEKAPPAKKELHWKPGRSAYELAAYMIRSLTTGPAEIMQCLMEAGINTAQIFDWEGEAVTDFAGQGLGRGSGRHHDTALWNDDVFVGIEAKADEPLDKRANEWLSCVSGNPNRFENRKKRLNGLCRMIWGEDYNDTKHGEIRYQLLTALGGVLLEANGCTEKRGGQKKNAVLLIMTFLKAGDDCSGRPYVTSAKVCRNEKDIDQFLSTLPNWDPSTGRVKTAFGEENHIEAFVKHITICVK